MREAAPPLRFTLHSLICSSLGAPPWCPCQQHHLQQGFPADITKEKVKQNIRKRACRYFCSSHPCKSNYFAILSASAFLMIFRSIIQLERKVKWVKDHLLVTKVAYHLWANSYAAKLSILQVKLWRPLLTFKLPKLADKSTFLFSHPLPS